MSLFWGLIHGWGHPVGEVWWTLHPLLWPLLPGPKKWVVMAGTPYLHCRPGGPGRKWSGGPLASRVTVPHGTGAQQAPPAAGSVLAFAVGVAWTSAGRRTARHHAHPHSCSGDPDAELRGAVQTHVPKCGKEEAESKASTRGLVVSSGGGVSRKLWGPSRPPDPPSSCLCPSELGSL